MGKHAVSSKAECPFYKAEDERVIYCEGVEKGATIQMVFPGSASHYKIRCCYNQWEKCMIAKALISKYN